MSRLQPFPSALLRPAQPCPALLTMLGLLLASLLFCRCAKASELDAITSEPPAQPEQATEVPFFGDPVDVEEEPPQARQEERPAPRTQAPKRTDAARREPKPQPPRAEASPRRPSGRLEIPEDAARRGDLAFLKGCWHMEKRAAHRDKPGMPYARTIQESVCLDGRGGGTFRVHDFDHNWTASTRARARFSGSTLVFEHGDLTFPDGSRFYGSSFQCRGAGVGTSCAMYCPKCRYLPRHRVLRITRAP